MAERFRLTLAQLNPVVGDFAANAVQAVAAWQAGRDAGARMVALPEIGRASCRERVWRYV